MKMLHTTHATHKHLYAMDQFLRKVNSICAFPSNETVVVCLEILPKSPFPFQSESCIHKSCFFWLCVRPLNFIRIIFLFDIRWRHNDKLFHGSIADHHCASLLSFKIMDFIPECHTYDQNLAHILFSFFWSLFLFCFILFSCLDKTFSWKIK